MPQTPKTRTPREAKPRGPFVFDLRELGRQPGTLREYRRTVPATEGFGLEVIGVPLGASIDLDLRLESATEGVLVTGTVSAPLTGQCARCLDPIAEDLTVDVVELFAYADSVTDETSELDEIYRVDGDLLDVEPVARDAVVLALPWTPLCRPDCAGLCPDCGQRFDDLPAGHAHESVDPRWAVLAAFAEPSPADSTSTDRSTT